MAKYTKKVQTVLSEQQFDRLQSIADEKEKPISVLLREEVVQNLIQRKHQQKRRKALDNLLSMNTPVSDWEKIEQEIEKGKING